MALLHAATITPTKLELIDGWLATQDWYDGASDAPLERAGAFRFDDPAGEVGVETFLVRSGGGPVHQVPLTYRATPFAEGEPWLICTMEHSVLGTRWVYDGVGDPVYAVTLAATILGGGTQAPEYIEVDGRLQSRAVLAEVVGSGSDSAQVDVDAVSAETVDGVAEIRAGRLVLRVPRAVGSHAAPPAADVLTGTWAGQDEPALLAYVESR